MRRALTVAALLLAAGTSMGHESEIDHVDRTLSLRVEHGALVLTYRCRLTERMALMRLRAADVDGDGIATDAEWAAAGAAEAARLAGLLRLELDGASAAWTPAGSPACDAALGLTFRFSAPLAVGTRAGLLVDGALREYPGEARYVEERDPPAGARAIACIADAEPPGTDRPIELRLRFQLP